MIRSFLCSPRMSRGAWKKRPHFEELECVFFFLGWGGALAPYRR